MTKIFRKLPENVLEILGFFKVMAIVGARQGGKTTYAKQIEVLMPDSHF